MLVTEFMELGDLYRALQADDKPGNRRFSWYRTSPAGERMVNGLSKRIALDVVRGLAFLHSRSIVHFGGAPCCRSFAWEDALLPCISSTATALWWHRWPAGAVSSSASQI